MESGSRESESAHVVFGRGVRFGVGDVAMGVWWAWRGRDGE